MSLLGRDELLSKTNSRRYKVVSLDVGEVRIQSLTNQEMRQLRISMLDRKGELNRSRSDRLQELLVSRCAVSSDGVPLFTESEAINGAFDNIDGGVVTALFSACKQHTGFAADEDFTLIEDAVKNSETDPTNSSVSA